MKLLLVLALVALLHGRSLEKRALPEDLIWDGMNMGDVNKHRIIRPIPYIGEHALDRQIRGLIRDGVIIEKVPFSLRDDVIIEKVPFGIRDDVIIEKIPYNAEVLEGVLVELKNRYENLRQEIHNQLDNKLEDVRQAYQLASAIVAENVDNVKSSPEYQQAVAEAKRIKDELKQVLEDKYGNAKEKIDELLGEKSEELGKIAERVHEGIAKGVDQAKKVVAGIRGWVWDAVDEFLEPYTDRKRRQIDVDLSHLGIKDYVTEKVKEAMTAAKNAKDNFDVEKFKTDLKEEVQAAIDTGKGIGQQLGQQLKLELQAIIGGAIQDASNKAFAIKSQWDESYLKASLVEGIEKATEYLNDYIDNYGDREEFDRQVELLRLTVKHAAETAIGGIRAGVSDLKQVKDSVVEKVTQGLNSIRNQMKNFDLEQVRESIISEVNAVVDRVENINKDDARSTFETVKDKAKDLGARIGGGLKNVAEKVGLAKRELKSYQQMSAEERAQWDAIIDELKQVLKDKYGVQDPEEAYRLSPENREKLAELRKEFLQKHGQTGHDDLTDDEFKKNWGDVARELEAKFNQKRELKSFQQMSPEERDQWNSVLAELRQVLKDKFGIQDPDEAYRLSPESREKLAELRKEFLQKHGQTGHDDLTDDEFKKNWGNVASELEAKFNQKRGLKSFQQMSPEERDQWNSVLAELRQVLRNKFGIQDPDEAYRLSPESREKLAELRKEFLQKHGQTGHDDLTDAEVKDKYQNVLDELKQMFGPRRVD